MSKRGAPATPCRIGKNILSKSGKPGTSPAQKKPLDEKEAKKIVEARSREILVQCPHCVEQFTRRALGGHVSYCSSRSPEERKKSAAKKKLLEDEAAAKSGGPAPVLAMPEDWSEIESGLSYVQEQEAKLARMREEQGAEEKYAQAEIATKTLALRSPEELQDAPDKVELKIGEIFGKMNFATDVQTVKEKNTYAGTLMNYFKNAGAGPETSPRQQHRGLLQQPPPAGDPRCPPPNPCRLGDRRSLGRALLGGGRRRFLSEAPLKAWFAKH